MVKSTLLIAASAIALVQLTAPAAAQHMNMPGMTMPMPMPAAKAASKKAIPKKLTAKKLLAKKSAAKKATYTSRKTAVKRTSGPKSVTDRTHSASMAMPMDHRATPMTANTTPSQAPMDHSQMDHGAMRTPAQPGLEAHSATQMPMDHSQTDPSQIGQTDMPMADHAGHKMAMTGALGSYPMERESSGTAWQPDTSEHSGIHVMSGDWTLMAHGVVNFVYDHQSGPRGNDKAFVSGMLMGMARRPLGNGTLQFKAMASPDPIMGPKGYPLLLASGESANGTDRLIDRQHPHDLFMELSASISQNIGLKSSAFLYAGLPGEPAFGPPAFMHREAIMDSPEAPISHHWLDSTHISFGVLTGGAVLDRVKLEVSRFNAREPDQHRWDIETGPLDSTAIRVSWNPTRTVALQGSWGHFVDPEQLEPGVNQHRWSASALWANEIARGWKAAATLAWGRKSAHGHNDDAVAAEGSLKHANWTVFSRAELTENRELTNIENGPAYRVGKISVGAVRDFDIAKHFSLGAGGLLAVNFVPDALAADYGDHHPIGAMGFLRLKLH